ncbi:MAG: hypothetical protein ACI8PB_001663 [Desulforhopalus sp.]|jgi:hypothetical protein
MGFNRAFIRVPFVGDVSLSYSEGLVIQARAIDICEAGIGIEDYSKALIDNECEINVSTVGYGDLSFIGRLAHTYKTTAGLKITYVNDESLVILKRIVADYQATEAFIQRIDQAEVIDDWFVDSDGKYIDVVFEIANK